MSLLFDDFTGSDGSAVDAGKWATGYTGTGASTAIQSNRGRWKTGTAGGYAGTARISRRAVITSPTDVEVTGTYTPQGQTYPEIYVRATDTVFDTHSGYALRLPTQGGTSGPRIIRYVAYSGTTLGSASLSATTGTTYGFRFLVVGNSLKGRVWDTAGAEPGTWDIDVTDSTITSAGYVGLSVGAGNTGSTYVDFDDVVIDDASVPVDVEDSTPETLTLTDTTGQAGLVVLAPAADTLSLTDVTGATEVANEVYGAGIEATGIPVTAAETYTASVWARVSLANTLRVALKWLDSGSSVLDTTDGADTALVAGQWTLLTATGTAPASSDTLTVRVEVGDSGDPFLTGQTLDADALLVTLGSTVWTLTDGDSQGFTVERAQNDVVKAHPAGTRIELAEPWYWIARPAGGSDFVLPVNVPPPPPTTPPPSDTGSGETPGVTHPTTVTIGAQTYPLAGQDPTTSGGWGGDPNHTAYRGTDQLVTYSSASGSTTATNQWGVEVTVDATGVVTAVNDRQPSEDLTGTTIPATGYILSGHGAARDWLLQYATIGVTVQLTGSTTENTGGGTGGTGSGGTSSTFRSTLPWALGCFGNETGTAASAKVDAFAAMAGVALDFVDQHPDWDAIDGGDWWYAPHVNRGYNINVSTPLYSGSVTANNNAKWSTAAQHLKDNGWDAPTWRIGVEFNLNNSWKATDSNYSQWITAYQNAVDSVRSVLPNSRFILCMNEGNPQSCSQSTVDTIVNTLCGSGHVDMIGPDYYDQWEPIYNTSQATSRFGSASTPGTMNYWLARAKALGVKFALPEWGVASGTQWAGHQGGDNPFYMNYVMDWLYANRDTVEYVCYFEEPASYLRSDITTTATNPQARAAFQAKITQYKGYSTPNPGTGGGTGGGTTSGSWPVKVASDGHHLAYQDGTPFLYCADTAWVTISGLQVVDAKRYIDIKAAQGFNAMQCSLTAFSRTDVEHKRGLPFNGGDVTSPNLAYWAGVDELLAYMESKGMVAWLLPLWGSSNGSWGGGTSPSISAMSTYCTWLGNRYKNQGNIIWALGGDEQYSGDSEATARTGFWDAAAAALEATTPNQLKTFHPRWDNYSALSGASWLDFNSIQRNDNTGPYTWELAQTGYGYSKPFLNAEPPYYPSTAGGNATSRKRNRLNGIWTMLGGALGVVYGGPRNGTWHIGADPDYIYDWNACADVTGYDTGKIRTILSQYHWEKLAPSTDSSVLTSGHSSGTSYVAAGLATDGSLIVANLPDGGSTTVDLSNLAASGTAYWHDPTTGNVSGSGTAVTNSGTRSFTAPGNNAAGDSDWILVITTTAGRA